MKPVIARRSVNMSIYWKGDLKNPVNGVDHFDGMIHIPYTFIRTTEEMCDYATDELESQIKSDQVLYLNRKQAFFSRFEATLMRSYIDIYAKNPRAADSDVYGFKSFLKQAIKESRKGSKK